jgi:aspartate/methionine/tyrosine aminotransferase
VKLQIQPFKLERYFARYEFAVQYTLCSSDCESLSIADLLKLEEGAEGRFQEHWLGYTESQGAPELREAISRVYTTIQPEQVLVHSGAEEAIFLLMHALLAPGDHLIVHWPCYQSLFEIGRALGCEVTLWRARPENGWALDLDELQGIIRPNTRLIVVNLPHNPTGYLMPRSEFQELQRIAQERDVYLFSDEVYREIEHDPALRLPAACDLNEKAISLGVMSKSYGLAGLRIGWIATRDARVYERMAGLKDYTTICNSAPSEFLAGVALRHREQLTARNLEIILRNLELLDAFFAHRGEQFAWKRPSAGPIAFPRLLDGEVEAFCTRLADTAGVLLLPGTLYDHGGNHFRIGFGRRNLPAALEKLEEFLDAI